MKAVILIYILLLSGSTLWAAPGLTLKEAYALALKQSETLAIQKELIKETEGLMLQSLSTALPKLAFAYSQKWQDASGERAMNSSVPEAKFTLSQPLFTGFKEFAAIKASKHVGRQRDAELKRAKELLFMDVADAFYLYLSYQDARDVLSESRRALMERLTELRRREALGRSRISEVASAEARLGRTEAELEGVAAQLAVAGQLLEFLVGQKVDGVIAEDLPVWDVAPEALYQKADTRQDVIAAREAFESFKNNVTSARSAFFPEVVLKGNAYTKRGAAYEGNDWDATLTVDVPIFNGTTDIGAYQQARAQRNAADLKWSMARRKALLEIRSAHIRWDSALRSLLALNKAVISAERNYDLQVEDFKRSLVNNLEVLQALEDLQSIRRIRVAQENDTRRAFWALKVAVGEIE